MKMKNKWFWSSVCFLFLSFLGMFTHYFYNYQYDESLPNTIKSDISFQEITKTLDLNTMFPDNIKVKSDGEFEIFFAGKTVYNSYENHPKDITKITGGSKSFAIYSLSFLRNLLLNNAYKNLSAKSEKELLDLVTTINEMDNEFPLHNKYILGDHPVSDRLETLMLYDIYCREQGKEFLFKKEISHLASLLQQPYFYTYDTNHGLMQLRAQLLYAVLTKNKPYAKSIQEKIKEVIPIFVANDGSILEAGAHYHFYIKKQFEEYQSLLSLYGISDNALNESIKKQKKYTENLINHKNFLQGFGESYSRTIKGDFNHKNTVFRYQNKLAGIKFTNDLDTISSLFISLDNKPQVHKLKEDLSFYLYYNQPFFSNSGTYSYDAGRDRDFIQSKKSQNGPKFWKDDIYSSDVELLDINNDSIVKFSGIAENKDKSKSITREVIVNTHDVSFEIVDRSNKDTITSRYIIHPDISLQKINEQRVMLSHGEDSVSFSSNVPIRIDSTWVSPSLKQKTPTQFLQIKGLHLITNLQLNTSLQNIRFHKTNFSDSYDKIDSVESLGNKYDFILTPFFLNMSFIFYGIIFLIIVLLGIFIKPIKNYLSVIYILFGIILLYDIFFDNYLMLNLFKQIFDFSRKII